MFVWELIGLYNLKKRYCLIQPNYNSNLICHYYKRAKTNCLMKQHIHTAIHTKWQKCLLKLPMLQICRQSIVHASFKVLLISFLGSMKHCLERRKILNLSSWLVCSLIPHLRNCSRKIYIFRFSWTHGFLFSPE